MNRILLSLLTVPLVIGCVAPAERVPLQPLPENGQVLPYPELLTRVRAQANAANDAFYLNHWSEVEDLARGIEQTARFLSKAQEVPPKNKDILNEVTSDLAKHARELKAAASAKNEKDVTEAMKQITIKIRQLRLAD
jgi:hypothetical protein